MSYKLKKPYTEKQRLDFIAEYGQNCNQHRDYNMVIEKTETAIYALEPNEIMEDGKPVINPDYEAQKAQEERERISMLILTAADVERAIYKAKGMDFDDIIEQLSSYPTTQLGGLDLKALKIELKANNFYRGNPYIEQVGTLLGFTPQMLDEFFITKDYKKLIAPVIEEDKEIEE